MNCCSRMNSSSKENKETENEESQVGVEHRVRLERDYCVYPSKLSKREIEDLYYKMLQENIELKKTLNLQEDKIKHMTVAMRRMSRDDSERKKPLFGSEKEKERECCANARAVVNKQKESICELRKENELLAERIKHLTMKLCSAKQYLDRRPSAQPRSAKSASRLTTSGGRNLSSSTLRTKESQVTMKNKSASFPQQSPQEPCKEEEPKLVETKESTMRDDGTVKPKDVTASTIKSCEENRCRTLMEELTLKIGSLEDELAKTHDEYSGRIALLELEVVELQKQNLRVRNDIAARIKTLQKREQATQAQCDNLAVRLSIEKSKVSELETQMRSANLSNQIAKTIEGELAKKMEPQQVPVGSSLHEKKPLDDSGYVEQRNMSEDTKYSLVEEDNEQEILNKEVLDRITFLQEQLVSLKVVAAGDPPEDSSLQHSDVDCHQEEQKMKEESNEDILKNIDKIDHAIKHKGSISGSYEGRGELDETNRSWVDHDLLSDEVLCDRASSISPPFNSARLEKDPQDDKKHKKTTSDSLVPGPIPTTSTPIDQRKGPTKMANPFHPPQTRNELETSPDYNTTSPYNASQTVRSQQSPLHTVNQPDGCPNEHTRNICNGLLSKSELNPNGYAKRKCEKKSNTLTRKSGIRQKQGMPVFDAKILTRCSDILPNERLNTLSKEKYCKSTDETETDFSSSTEQSHRKESPKSWRRHQSRSLSPGERRDSVSTAADSLSEGEIPADSARGNSKSAGETETTHSLNSLTTSQKMAEMLQSVSEEMMRCRLLLKTKRPSQPMVLPAFHTIAS